MSGVPGGPSVSELIHKPAAELAGEDIQLVVGDGKPGEPGEVRNLLPADVRCRGFGGHVPPGRCAAEARNQCGRW